ncbi:MAG: patatin-like phospholipase family protein [Owenweeksia sp.]|nr:patatin-like phospholipase family protein [Owenweeksia sp.]
MAQVGALQIMDSLGIPSIVLGTSMGAIIGSMYAMGFPANEIEKYLRDTDWEALLSNEVPRNRLGYFDRKAESRYLMSFSRLEMAP